MAKDFDEDLEEDKEEEDEEEDEEYWLLKLSFILRSLLRRSQFEA